MLARASADVRLRPGDLVGSGTVGTGCLLETKEATLGRYLEPGDVVTLAIERLGELRNPHRGTARLNDTHQDRTIRADAVSRSGATRHHYHSPMDPLSTRGSASNR